MRLSFYAFSTLFLFSLNTWANDIGRTPAYIGYTHDGTAYGIIRQADGTLIGSILPEGLESFSIEIKPDKTGILITDGTDDGIELPISQAEFDTLLAVDEELLPGVKANAIAFLEPTENGSYYADFFLRTPDNYHGADIKPGEWTDFQIKREQPGILEFTFGNGQSARIGYPSYEIVAITPQQLDPHATLLMTESRGQSPQNVAIVIDELPFPAELTESPEGLHIQADNWMTILPKLNTEDLDFYFNTSLKSHHSPYLAVLVDDHSDLEHPYRNVIFLSQTAERNWLALPINLDRWTAPNLKLSTAKNINYPIPFSMLAPAQGNATLASF